MDLNRIKKPLIMIFVINGALFCLILFGGQFLYLNTSVNKIVIEKFTMVAATVNLPIGLLSFGFLVFGLCTKCPSCKKWWAQREKEKIFTHTDRVAEGERDVPTSETKHYDTKKQYTGSSVTYGKETVYRERKHYKHIYVCSYCKHQWEEYT